MAAPYSDDLRRKAIEAFDRGEHKSHICRTLNIGRSTFDTWLQRREDTGSFSACRDYLRGPEPKVSDLETFRQFAEANGHLTQKAMAELWPTPISDRTISKLLSRLDLRKKKTYGYRERDDAKRQAFLETIAEYDTDDRVYVDEAGVNNTLDYEYGWCTASERFYDLKLGHRTQRISMIAGWCNRTALAPLTFEGYCHTDLVETWVQKVLVPALKPGQVVVVYLHGGDG